jgi:hypothetical protein
LTQIPEPLLFIIRHKTQRQNPGSAPRSYLPFFYFISLISSSNPTIPPWVAEETAGDPVAQYLLP